MNALVTLDSNAEVYRASTDAASLCKDIVVASATVIQGRKYVCVEGWQAIAVAHGCAAGSRDVEKVDGGVRAIGEVRRMSDGVLIATAEGFVGEDEPTWYGGPSRGKTLPKRADYAIRAMAQTRAISRACRSAFAHVVVMMNAGLATTPAEEVPFEGFDNGRVIEHEAPQEPAARTKLEGVHSSKTALRNAINDIIAKVREAQSEREIDAIQKENIETIKQANRDWPLLLTGDPNIAEDVGLKGTVEIRRAEVQDRGQFQMLLDSMKAMQSLKSYTNWRATNEAIVDELDDAQRREFEREADAFEAGLTAVAAVQAG